ncbi:MAG TPA: ABC transporter ATP-binding protein [Syntrophales bacterium]|nr:ABC transporter ATP-binding protein [Syntrophales bacterium]
MEPEYSVICENLSKKFKIYASPNDRIREALSFSGKSFHKDFWALRNVSFRLRKGVTLGIMGFNGSGKSTLLKMICGYLAPTSGSVKTAGRVASILELGTGFNREFTGRENVMLYGGLMGFSVRETREKMEEVEAFADIGDFFDRPVKLYSSGMYARLAFACTIHMEPDILVIDEALAVGDIAFQHKCIHRIRSLQKREVSLLFVSHSIGAVKSLCQEALFLDRGRLVLQGKAEDVANYYHGLIAHREQEKKEAPKNPPVMKKEAGETKAAVRGKEKRIGTGEARIEEVRLRDDGGGVLEVVEFDQPVSVGVRILARVDCSPAVVGFIIRDRFGNDLLGTNTAVEGRSLPPLRQGEELLVTFRLRLPLLKGNYSVTAAVGHDPDQPAFLDWWDHACVFEVLPPASRRTVNCKVHLPIAIDVQKKGGP